MNMNILFRTRTFSERFSLVFEWMRSEWKPILKYVTLFLLPVSLLQGFGLSGITESSFSDMLSGGSNWSDMSATNLAGIALYYVCAIVGALFIYGLCLFFVRRNLMEGQSNEGLKASEVWRGAMSFVPRLILSGIVVMVIMVAAVILFVSLTVLSPWTAILTLPACIALMVAFIPLLPVYTLTAEGLFSSISHSLRLGFKCWMGFFSTVFVMGLLTMVIGSFASIPLYLAIMVKALVGSDLSATSAGMVDFFNYIGGVITTYVSYALTILTVGIICVQYGHAADKFDGVTAQKEVDEFPEF